MDFRTLDAQNFSKPIDTVRAEIKDAFTDFSIGSSISCEICDEPGITEFVFSHRKFGSVGKIRLLKRSENECRVRIIRPRLPSERELFELIANGNLVVDLDGPIGTAFYLYLRNENKKAIWDDLGKTLEGEANEDIDPTFSSITPEDLKAAQEHTERLRRQILEKRMYYYVLVTNSLLFDLRQWVSSYEIRYPEQEEPPLIHNGGTWEDWFRWRDARLKDNRPCTLQDIANKNGKSYGYVRQLHSAWKVRQEIEP